MLDDFYSEGRKAASAALRFEFRAHRSLWIGALFFMVCASFAAPLLIDYPYGYLHASARLLGISAAIVSAFVLWVLRTLFRALILNSENYGRNEQQAFLKGVKATIFPPLLASTAIIVVVLGFLL